MVVLMSDFISLLDCYRFCGVNYHAQLNLYMIHQFTRLLSHLRRSDVLECVMVVLMSDFVSILDYYRYCGVHCHAWLYLYLISLVYLIVIAFAKLFIMHGLTYV